MVGYLYSTPTIVYRLLISSVGRKKLIMYMTWLLYLGTAEKSSETDGNAWKLQEHHHQN